MRFGIRFYKALGEGATIGEAFELASAEVITMDGEMAERISRGFVEEEQEAAKWGIFYKPDQAEVLDLVLPTKMSTPQTASIEPNEYLIRRLWEGLEPYSIEIQLLAAKKRASLPRQRMAILNALPAPIAEHLRKLMVPIKDEAGFNQLTEQRLHQMVRTYLTVMELLSFTLMGQLWETFF